ncbi:MAG: hypothetical protein ACYDDI_01045 [Candidatus Acidiferrales bacterium]
MLPSKKIKKSIRVLEFANRNHVSIDFDEAQQFLRVRSKLAANPRDAEALRTMRHFEIIFHYAGRDPEDVSLSISSPACPPECAECAERRRRRAANE